jgi:hypothetical protein
MTRNPSITLRRRYWRKGIADPRNHGMLQDVYGPTGPSPDEKEQLATRMAQDSTHGTLLSLIGAQHNRRRQRRRQPAAGAQRNREARQRPNHFR